MRHLLIAITVAGSLAIAPGAGASSVESGLGAHHQVWADGYLNDGESYASVSVGSYADVNAQGHGTDSGDVQLPVPGAYRSIPLSISVSGPEGSCSAYKELGPQELVTDGETFAHLQTTLTENDGNCVGDVTIDWARAGIPERTLSQNAQTYPHYAGGTTLYVGASAHSNPYWYDQTVLTGDVLGTALSGTGRLGRTIGATSTTTVQP